MIEKPLERLNYFNGQRLEASDLKTEQDYHIRVRRWLNKSLYSAGIAEGLEVRSAGTGRFVVVSPGLALDSIGREIIVLEEETVEVFSYAGTDASTVEGNYLVVEYSEERTAFEKSSGCVVRHNGSNGGNCGSLSDGPSRVQAKPKFSSVRFPPPPGSNQVALARIELADNCSNIGQIDTSIRRYIGPASQAKVRQYALEGEREVAFVPRTLFPVPQPPVDFRTAGRVYFHVRGRQPTGVTLFLKAEALSSLYYTELGTHTHSSSVNQGQGAMTGPATAIDSHHHSGTSLTAVNEAHAHGVWGFVSNSIYHGKIPPLDPGEWIDAATSAFISYPAGPWALPGGANFDAGTPPYMLRMVTAVGAGNNVPHLSDLGATVGINITDASGHDHAIEGDTGEPVSMLTADGRHRHAFSASINSFGVAIPARSGAPLTYLSNLQISIDGKNKTSAIREQIVDSVAANLKAAWSAGIGDGTDSHPLVAEKGVAIRLDFLPEITFGEGEHVIEFSVDAGANGGPNGGRVLYNLYIE